MATGISSEFNPSIIQANYLIRKHLLRAFTRLAPRLSGRMMDFGCGSKPYKSLFSVEEYLGVDYENPGHPHLNEQIDVFYDGRSLPFPDNHFNSAFSSEVFEHIFNLQDILKELYRVIKTDGLLLISCPFAYCEHEVPHDFARYSSFGLRHLLEQNGFEIIEQEKTGNSIETIHQLALIYLHFNVYKWVKNIPVVRSMVRILFNGGFNISARLLSFLLPNDKSLYLNNIVLCKKKAEVL